MGIHGKGEGIETITKDESKGGSVENRRTHWQSGRIRRESIVSIGERGGIEGISIEDEGDDGNTTREESRDREIGGEQSGDQ